MAKPIISTEHLTKVYDGQSAVDELSLSIEKGEIFGLLGPNGAGKSTTILMMLGLIEPTGGKVQVCGIDPITHPIDVKERVGYLPDDLGFYQNMTGLQNLLYTASLNGISKKEAERRALELLDIVGLMDAKDKKAGTYSRGMKQRLGLADVLMKDPEVIILDEPTLGIDPEGVREILQLIQRLNREKELTVLVSSHHLHQVQQICDRVGIFVEGKLLAVGNIHDLADQLFEGELYVVDVEVHRISQEMIARIENLEGVNRIEQINEQSFEVYCEEDVTSSIAQAIFESQAELKHIRRKDYGLDEIYHRYFEGREEG